MKCNSDKVKDCLTKELTLTRNMVSYLFHSRKNIHVRANSHL